MKESTTNMATLQPYMRIKIDGTSASQTVSCYQNELANIYSFELILNITSTY